MNLRTKIAYEDAVTFVNAAFACSGQREYYGDRAGQRVSIGFLHEYMRVNYRRLYARCLAVDINHFNQGRIVTELLSSSREGDTEERAFEGALVRRTLRRLPPQRALRALNEARRRHVNNRRLRAAIRDYLAGRPDPDFDAVKYRSLVRALVAHAHLRLPAERARFLFEGAGQRRFETPIFEAYRRASREPEALYALPFSIAEGFALRHRIPRARFLARAQATMTERERARAQARLTRANKHHDVDFSTATLAQLTSHLVNLPVEVRAQGDDLWRARLDAAARKTASRAALRLGRVALVLDRSRSMQASLDKPRRPLAVALAVEALVRATATSSTSFWTAPTEDSMLVVPYGHSDLATALLEALATKPDLLLIVSDGFDNDPPQGAHLVLEGFRRHLDPKREVSIVHLNPVFDDAGFTPRALSSAVPTVGLRDAKDLPAALGFARLADGTASLEEVESYLHQRAVARLKEDLHDPA